MTTVSVFFGVPYDAVTSKSFDKFVYLMEAVVFPSFYLFRSTGHMVVGMRIMYPITKNKLTRYL